MFGLKQEEIEILKKCFQLLDEVSEVIVFGSRAMGNHKTGSDIDIALKGVQVNHRSLSKAMDYLEQTTLPYAFDLVIYDKIQNQELKGHIDSYGVTL